MFRNDDRVPGMIRDEEGEWNGELTVMVLVESDMRSAAGDEGTNGDDAPGRRKVEAAASTVEEDEVVEGEAPGLRSWLESNEESSPNASPALAWRGEVHGDGKDGNSGDICLFAETLNLIGENFASSRGREERDGGGAEEEKRWQLGFEGLPRLGFCGGDKREQGAGGAVVEVTFCVC
jgi:hypothetical protein